MSVSIWVAKRDGTGWASNRTRDAIDLAFTVDKDTPAGCHVQVRCTRGSDPKARAVRVIGELSFRNHYAAKQVIETYVKSVNNMAFISRDEARAWFLEKLLELSNEKYQTSYGSLRTCLVYYNATWHGKVTAPVSPVITATPSSMASTISEIAEAVAPAINEVPVVDISSLRPGDPAPTGYIWLNKNLVKIGWPS
jgi:hypothetical protein